MLNLLLTTDLCLSLKQNYLPSTNTLAKQCFWRSKNKFVPARNTGNSNPRLLYIRTCSSNNIVGHRYLLVTINTNKGGDRTAIMAFARKIKITSRNICLKNNRRSLWEHAHNRFLANLHAPVLNFLAKHVSKVPYNLDAHDS